MTRTNQMQALVEQLLADRTARYDGRVELQTETAAYLSDVQAAHAAMAEAQRELLTKHHTQLTNETGAFLAEARTTHANMAQAQQEAFANNRELLEANRDQLATETDIFLSEVRAAHANMAQAQRERLEADHAQLVSENALFKDRMSVYMDELHADSAGMAEAWRMMTSIPTKKKVAPAMSEPKTTTDSEAAVGNGELTEIYGIGVATQAKLHAAGILTFKQLSTTPAEEICEIVGTMSRLDQVKEWIEEAKMLAGDD